MQTTSATQASDTPIWTQDHAQAVDALCADMLPSAVLMEHAAIALRDAALEILADYPCQLLIIAGKGNNGGDALAVARLLIYHQPDVLLTNAAPTSPLAIDQLYAVRKLGLQPELYEPSAWLQRKYLGKPLLIIDGIVGLGLKGELASPLQALIAEVQLYANKKVLAIDIPTGLRCDYADVGAKAIKADLTLTFGGKKLVHVLPPARDYCGEVRVAKIFPSACVAETFAKSPSPLYMRGERSDNYFAGLPDSAHKYQRGHVLVIGGSAGKCGAPLLAGLAALRTGAGWVSVAMPAVGEGYSLPLDLTYENFFTTGAINLPDLMEYVEQRQVRAIVIGCGCVASPIDVQVWQYLLKFAQQKGSAVVIDAGALDNIFALRPDTGESATQNIILTPHGGEWKRLAKDDIDNKDKLQRPDSLANITASQNIAARRGMTLVYKNSSPLVFSPQRPAYVCDGGDNTLAKAGTGDIYAGIVAALTLVTDSQQAAVSAHSRLRQAAHRARTHGASVGKNGMTASLLLDNLRGD